MTGFTQIDNDHPIWGPEIPPELFRTFMELARFSFGKGKCFPGRELLAERIGCSVRQVSRNVGRLQEMGLIRMEHRANRTTTYVLVDAPATGHPRPALRDVHVPHYETSMSREEDEVKKMKEEGQSRSDSTRSTKPRPARQRSAPHRRRSKWAPAPPGSYGGTSTALE